MYIATPQLLEVFDLQGRDPSMAYAGVISLGQHIAHIGLDVLPPSILLDCRPLLTGFI